MRTRNRTKSFSSSIFSMSSDESRQPRNELKISPKRLTPARGGRFVGRTSELDLFRSVLETDQEADAMRVTVLFVHGPGGVGKTTLLREFGYLAEAAAMHVVRLDARNIDPTPTAFLIALRQSLGVGDDASPFDALARRVRSVLLFDTFEAFSPLDCWFVETFLPQVPAGCLVVVAGRDAPTLRWRSAANWPDAVRVLPLRNLPPEESRAYLLTRGVPTAQHGPALDFTHGHPLALSLVADVLARCDRQEPFSPDNQPDIVRALLGHFVQNVPTTRHRLALEACAHVRVTTEDLLARALGVEDAHDLFEWLRGLSFIEQGPQGLFPHDLVRDVVDADLRWRNRETYRGLHARVRDWVVERIHATHGPEQQRAFFDLLYLHRNNPVMKPYYDWNTLGRYYGEPVTPQDHEAIVNLVKRHEGEASACIASYWLSRQPDAFIVFRSPDGVASGFVALLLLNKATSDDVAADPAMQAAWTFIARRGPLRAGERILFTRFFMAADTYQHPSPAFDLTAAASATRWLTTPKLAWAFTAAAIPDHWEAMFRHIDFPRCAEADFEVGGRHFGAFAHDWRAEPPTAWLDVMVERELATDLTPDHVSGSRPAPLLVLSQPEFEEAVRRALRDFARNDDLAANPLLRSRVALERAAGRPTAESLRDLIRQAAERLRAKPKDEKFYKALNVTYLTPAPTQELAAERLDVPFGTYRYQLAVGIERVTSWLWERELSGDV
jgi:AAA ATPase domain